MIIVVMIITIIVPLIINTAINKSINKSIFISENHKMNPQNELMSTLQSPKLAISF